MTSSLNWSFIFPGPLLPISPVSFHTVLLQVHPLLYPMHCIPMGLHLCPCDLSVWDSSPSLHSFPPLHPCSFFSALNSFCFFNISRISSHREPSNPKTGLDVSAFCMCYWSPYHMGALGLFVSSALPIVNQHINGFPLAE